MEVQQVVGERLKALAALYRKPVQASRGGPLFNAFPYPTKISPETIALFIAAHTSPGDTVFDGFAGSGSTGLAAILCGRPSQRLQDEANRLGLRVQWGPRRAILYEVGVLGSFISRVLCSPPDPAGFSQAAHQLLADVESLLGWLYEARDTQGQTGSVRHTIWSDVLCCPQCGAQVTLWDACVSRSPADISQTFTCPQCEHQCSVDHVPRVTEEVYDDLLDLSRTTRIRRPVWVYGSTDGQTWHRAVQLRDLSLLQTIESIAIPDSVPLTPIPWGDLYRRGYHEGITHLHHFYTRRNLIVFSALWQEVQKYPAYVRDALRFWLLSYNASHTTIMTRAVAKRDQKDLVVTSSQPGVLYVSGLPVEKNVFAGLRRKLTTITQAFEASRCGEDLVQVRNASCLDVDLPDESVDYVFTDPPFGGNIPYAEVSLLNEAWLGPLTNSSGEVTVSPHQGKTLTDYEALLRRAFQEAYRVLRPTARATLVFHSSSAHVWNALSRACRDAGFGVASASVLDKTQGSFKQVTAKGAVRGDPLLLLHKAPSDARAGPPEVWATVDELLRQAVLSRDPSELTPQRIYSRLVGQYLAGNHQVPINARAFYRGFPGPHAKSNGE